MRPFDAPSYFAQRAPRYRAALESMPLARVLDLLPYAAVIRASRLDRRPRLRVCDAFGGTGFLARGLRGRGRTFVVCDCCPEMIGGAAGLQNVELHVTSDDFRSALARYGEGQFDLVLCHAGLHHVVVASNGTADVAASANRQLEIASRLASLTKPGGLLVIADIPRDEPPEQRGRLQDEDLDHPSLCEILGSDEANMIARAVALDMTKPRAFDAIHERLRTRLVEAVSGPVPRCFFDEFVAVETLPGHVAVYPDFTALDATLRRAGLVPWGRINYLGPWLFGSEAEAGWFFREKFCVGQAAPLGADPEGEQQMFRSLRDLLGVRTVDDLVAVNWGVTYAAYQRGA